MKKLEIFGTTIDKLTCTELRMMTDPLWDKEYREAANHQLEIRTKYPGRRANRPCPCPGGCGCNKK